MSKEFFSLNLSEIADVVAGQSPESIYYSNIEGVPFLQGNRTFGALYPTIDTYTSKVTKLAKKDEVLMSVRAPVGDLNFAPCDLCIGRGLASIKAKNGNNKFVYYALKYNINNLLRQGSGTTFDSVNKDLINDFELIIPEDKTDRDKATNVLSVLDSKIELNNCINTELEAMAKTLYDYWFVQFDFPDKNGKPYKISGGKMVWNKELKREIPEGWEVKSIDYYANVIDPHPSHRAPREVINGYPFAGIGDIDEFGNIDINKARVIDEEFVLKQERDYTINDYSIGYGRVGTVGKVVKLRKQPFRFALSPTMAIINPKNNSLPSFVYYTVTNPTFLQWVNKYTSGSTRPAIGIQHLRTIPVIKPKVYSENLLEKFERIVETSFKQTDTLNKENQKLTELRDWLLPMLMNGQVKVKDEKETELSMAAEPKTKYGK